MSSARGRGRGAACAFSRRAACGLFASAIVAPLAGGLVALGCAGSPDANRTRVARVRQVVHTGVAAYDEFFAVVYQMQVALNEFERVRITLLADLADAMRLSNDADLDAIGAGLHDRALDLAQHGVRFAIDMTPEEAASGPPPRVGAPPGSGPGGAAAAQNTRAIFPRPQAEAAAHAMIEVRTEGQGTVSPDAARLGNALTTAMRNALGLRSRMEEIVTFTPQILTAGRTLAQGTDRQAPADQRAELRREFRDALEFLTGAGPRARAQAQISLRIAVRLRASAEVAAPDTDTDDDGTPTEAPAE